ncbi:hypothetical protein HMPREF9104_02422 [Lentilactobacillus kisonensis F0435]|uniref:Non-reducing end beta-L-arabinofuranosidase-like GH127 catalytic domain-containing protein n=1 Tax=Lentilactobacillus kisonensis F0435 TaxID=797516 RepID=H1LII1_9LACO|nr:hypothetical protein HMPREF9104_02422 [Lentilactobacillus kisonensis F0435]
MQVYTTPKLNKVKVTSDFWKRYRELVVKEVLPYQWKVMNDEADISISEDPQNNGQDKNSHAIANLKIAAGQMKGHHYGFPFQDTDVYKWLEAAAYSFGYHPNPDLKKITDNLIDLIADAQEDDGYLSTYFQIDAPERKFKRLQQSHELNKEWVITLKRGLLTIMKLAMKRLWILQSAWLTASTKTSALKKVRFTVTMVTQKLN